MYCETGEASELLVKVQGNIWVEALHGIIKLDGMRLNHCKIGCLGLRYVIFDVFALYLGVSKNYAWRQPI